MLSQTNLNEKSISELQVSARTIGRTCAELENEVKVVLKEYGPEVAKKNALSLSFDHKTLAGQQGENVSSALGILLTGTDLEMRYFQVQTFWVQIVFVVRIDFIYC